MWSSGRRKDKLMIKPTEDNKADNATSWRIHIPANSVSADQLQSLMAVLFSSPYVFTLRISADINERQQIQPLSCFAFSLYPVLALAWWILTVKEWQPAWYRWAVAKQKLWPSSSWWSWASSWFQFGGRYRGGQRGFLLWGDSVHFGWLDS